MSPKQRLVLTVGAGCLALIIVVIMGFKAGDGPENVRPAATGRAGSAIPPQHPDPSPAPDTKTRSQLPTKGTNIAPLMQEAESAASAASHQATLDAINTAAASYDPAELPKITPYLQHPDNEVREAALNGILTLGDAAGAPLLRDAAKLAATPQEEVKLLEAADYLELPSARLSKALANKIKASPNGIPKTRFLAPKSRPGSQPPAAQPRMQQ